MKLIKQLGVFFAFLGLLNIGEAWSANRTNQIINSEGTKEKPLTLLDLKVLLSTRPHYKANFQETHFSTILTEPLITSGTLTFSPPSKIEKHIMAPFEETYVVEGNRVYFENPVKGISKNFTLDEYPSLQGLLVGMQGPLTGDFKTLQQFFNLTLEGTKSQWTLKLEPLDNSFAEFLNSLSFTGRHNLITTIEIRESAGDYSLITIEEATH
jgi:outer membrane lipoprotein-sorting protein